MKELLVSCIVPCYNGASYLEASIESILGQTYRPIEVLVVDDGSTDASPEIVAGFGDAVRYHRQENGGPAAACNTGIALTSGELVAFLEQDDLWLADKLRRQVMAFLADDALDYCVSHIQNFWVPELRADEEKYRDHPAMQPVPGYVVQTLMARRTTFERAGLFDPELRFACAGAWFMRAMEEDLKGVLLPEVLTLRRLHEKNFSRLHRDASREQFLHVIKDMLDRRRRSQSGAST